jgi:hypothetical protein
VTTQEQLTKFLDEHVRWPRPPVGIWAGFSDPMADQWIGQQRPTAAEISDAWLEDAEFRALQLGTWLNTPDGQIIAAAVEAVSPPFYAEDEKLLVAALQHAAARQREEGVQAAGRNALIALGVAGVAALLFGLFGTGSGGGG